MIHPSYVDLMKVVNKNVEEGETPVINSRYSIVMATAKRARQIVDGDEPLVKVSRGEKPLAIAIDELNQEEIRILAEDEIEEEYVDPAVLAAEENADPEAAAGQAEPVKDDGEAVSGTEGDSITAAVPERSSEEGSSDDIVQGGVDSDQDTVISGDE